jgi:hypothetical protein
LQLAPLCNVNLPQRWFVTLFPSSDIRINPMDDPCDANATGSQRVGPLPLARAWREVQHMTQVETGSRFMRAGFWLLQLGFLMSYGMVLHYVVAAQYQTGEQF